jgi:N-acylneuraminate cytidylyltransferase
MSKLNVLTIIPARGGSKGINRKNLQIINGLPLIAHSIAHAHRASLVNRVIVSTDDSEITDISMAHGAEVVCRPANISDDKAPSELALLHVLDTLRIREKYFPDLVVFLQATSPYRRSQRIDQCISELIEKGADSGFSAYPQHFTGRWKLNSNGHAIPINFTLEHRPMRQDYPVRYLENGNLYVFQPWVLRETGNRLGGKIIIFPMDPFESLQIDDPEDLVFMEHVLQINQRHEYEDFSALIPIKLLVFDFDGVMTDNRVLVNHQGEEFVACSRSDSLGLSKIRDMGIKLSVLSTEKDRVVAARCQKLNMACNHGVDDKISKLQELADDLGLIRTQVGYVGNDINDLECMKWAGVTFAPSDAHPKIIELANFITPQQGGKGVVRQITDWFCSAFVSYEMQVKQ